MVQLAQQIAVVAVTETLVDQVAQEQVQVALV
jgi:hypothetical protein